MRCKRIFLAALLLMFLAVQVVPLMATDQLDSGIEFTDPAINNDDDDGNGGGEEHPWQDDDDDNDGSYSISKAIDYVISLFFDKQKEAKKAKKASKEVKSTKKQKSKKSWFSSKEDRYR